ncbi:H-NS family nucleoid-associated regulatory protein [Tropicimonas sp. IMCC6043]|uniref:H-NS histone family protein n=1 Tax=Tropicimonas sp. IMCC6043 TaxID=2510645 RepID=UPI00101C298B|nr:H-NS histone family protein [Tropicimonas sp. IMCC6043]RYH08801.1 H-NS histone family protein [Tropicimonas sp. IMCC6043]
MPNDLKKMSRAELEQLRKDVDKALSTLADRERMAALAAAEKAVKEYGFSLKELTGVAPARSKGKAKNPPKYRHPENPEITWTGRGRKPQWIKEAEDAGKDIDAFKI